MMVAQTELALESPFLCPHSLLSIVCLFHFPSFFVFMRGHVGTSEQQSHPVEGSNEIGASLLEMEAMSKEQRNAHGSMTTNCNGD